jgi:hypothetical protein
MKLIKHIEFNSYSQLWRLLINNHNNLLIESRDTVTKKVTLNCINLDSKTKLLNNISPEEDTWIGIEAFYDDYIIMHKFVKPDLPMHKGIILYSISKQKEIWENLNFTFLLISNNTIIAQQQGFEENKYFRIDINNGEVIETLSISLEELDILHSNYTSAFNYELYSYPESYSTELSFLDEFISNYTKKYPLKYNVEFLEFENFIFANFHLLKKDKLINQFIAIDKTKYKIIDEVILNSDINAYVPESFFMFKNYLILLVQKKSLRIYKVE